jgi:opacity protein-like surface antigen
MTTMFAKQATLAAVLALAAAGSAFAADAQRNVFDNEAYARR